MVFMDGGSIENLLETFTEGKFTPLTSKERVITETINWENEEGLAEQEDNCG